MEKTYVIRLVLHWHRGCHSQSFQSQEFWDLGLRCSSRILSVCSVETHLQVAHLHTGINGSNNYHFPRRCVYGVRELGTYPTKWQWEPLVETPDRFALLGGPRLLLRITQGAVDHCQVELNVSKLVCVVPGDDVASDFSRLYPNSTGDATLQ